MLVDTDNSQNTRIGSLPFGAVRWTGGLMKDVEERVMKRTVPQLILVNTFRCRSTRLANAIPVRLLYQKRQLIAFASIRGCSMIRT